MSVLAPLTLPERAEATGQVANMFRGKPLDFKRGVTCIHFLREQLVAFGYSPPVIPNFTTARGAKRALHKAGYRTIAELLDAHLTRIPPATMLVGDVALYPGEGFFEAVVVQAGKKVLGWHGYGELGLVNIAPNGQPLAAWRLI